MAIELCASGSSRRSHRCLRRRQFPHEAQSGLSADLAPVQVKSGEILKKGLPIRLRKLRPPGSPGENLATVSQGLLPVTVGQKAMVANPHETLRQDMQQKPAQKLLAREVQGTMTFDSAG